MAVATPPPLHFHKHPIPHLPAVSSPECSDAASDSAASPQPISLLTLLRKPKPLPAPQTLRTDINGSPTPILQRDFQHSDIEGSLELHHLKENPEHRKALKFAVAAPTPLPHPPLRPPTPLDDPGSDSDLGYEEDEEDGEFSDDEDYTTIPRAPGDYPFARSTNYGDEPTPNPHPAPAILPPPMRRGRGHIQVIDVHAAPKTCSRHCSPPPTRSRSGSEAARGRLSDAGPRNGRCGSPMPDVSDLPDVEDESTEESPPGPRWRRASEHLPGFRQYGRRASGEACPPALDETPVFVGSLRQGDSVYQRLESSITRARSVGSREPPLAILRP